MSRIHDALKKAELQKGATVGRDGVADPEAFKPHDEKLHEEWRPGAARQAGGWTKPGNRPESRGKSDNLLVERCTRHSWTPHPKAIITMDDSKQGLGAEELRTLRSRLYLARNARPLRKLLVTSALPKEGKSFTAGNLARVFASQPEQRVLLIDADLRLPTIHSVFGAPQTPGLTEYLSGKADEVSVIQRGDPDNLFLIPSGSHLPNAGELIGAGRIKVLLERVSMAFDWIVIDSPPILPVSDAKLLADLCDGVLMVVLMGSTPNDLAQRACRELAKGKLLGVVMNRADAKQAYGSYYYPSKR